MTTIIEYEIDENECTDCGEISDEIVDGICPECWMEQY
ncbi:MAG: hypothetical protein ACI8ZM_002487 [Crocinitomix sp.]|jgi:hypothetical protein